MGNDSSTPAPPTITHEQVVSIINASNTKAKEDSAKTAASLELIAYVLIVVVIIIALYIAYRLIVKFERMKTESNLSKAISLNNVKVADV